MSSESDFAYSLKYNTHFIVKNITGYTDAQILAQENLVIPDTVRSPTKVVNIFHYPINPGCVRDILQIPGIQEADIRASLLKGEIRHKFLCGDIALVSSNINLLQFSDKQRAFLENYGFNTGVQISYNEMNVLEQQDIGLVGAVNGINTVFTIPDGTWIQTFPYKIIVYKNGVKQVLGDDYIIAEGGGPGMGYNTIIFAVPPNVASSIPDVMTADYYVSN